MLSEDMSEKKSKPQLITRPTLEQIARHGNIFYEPMEYGGMEDEGISSPILGNAAAIGLMG